MAPAGSSTVTVSQKLPLVYLKDPVSVSGKALVQNANEIIVDGTYIFLYGIYVDPNLPKGIEAKNIWSSLSKTKSFAATLSPIRIRTLPRLCVMLTTTASTSGWWTRNFRATSLYKGQGRCGSRF